MSTRDIIFEAIITRKLNNISKSDWTLFKDELEENKNTDINDLYPENSFLSVGRPDNYYRNDDYYDPISIQKFYCVSL